jgi:hypothetical protein
MFLPRFPIALKRLAHIDPPVTASNRMALSAMGIHTTLLGPVTVYGDDAKSFYRKITHGRGTKAAGESAANGRRLVSTFAKNGTVTINLKGQPSEQRTSGNDPALRQFGASDSPKIS